MQKKWFKLNSLEEDGPVVIEHDFFEDSRGYFHRLFCCDEFKNLKFRTIKQVNSSFSKKAGTVRGLHYQKEPYSEAKIIFCSHGKINDYLLDLRDGSAHKGKVYKIMLCRSKGIFVPKGFAHGFQTLTDNTNLIYFHDEYYSSEHETGFSIMSSKMGIIFDMEISEISERDVNFSEYGE